MAEPVEPPQDEQRRSPDFVQSLERGLAVIRAFGPGRDELTLSDVARATGLTRAAARRFLLTLAELGYVSSDGRAFSLRPRVLELGYAYLSTLGFAEVAAPHMEELVATVHESSSVAVLDGDDIVYVVRVPTTRIMTVTIAVGTRFPAYATSMGRVLLAAMDEGELGAYLQRARLETLTRRTVTDPARLRGVLQQVATQGFAVVDQELEDGLRSAAAPIVDASGAVAAAMNVSVHASRVSLVELRRTYVPQLVAAAGQVSADLQRLGVAAQRRSR
jgi:IclR family pca regulon transcriptional regulator